MYIAELGKQALANYVWNECVYHFLAMAFGSLFVLDIKCHLVAPYRLFFYVF